MYTPGFGHRSNGINSFYQVDCLGSTRYVADVAGSDLLATQSYDAWGRRDQMAPGSPNWPTDLQFAGGWGYQSEWSNSPNEPGLGLDYLQQRYYDPVVGRFMQPDPTGPAGGLNLYEYVDDDPVTLLDPDGVTPTRYEAFQLAKERAGIPGSQSPSRWWTVGDDPARAASSNSGRCGAPARWGRCSAETRCR